MYSSSKKYPHSRISCIFVLGSIRVFTRVCFIRWNGGKLILVGSEESHLTWREDLGKQPARGQLMGGRGESSSPWNALRRVAPLMILASFLVCLVLYYVSPMGAAAVYGKCFTFNFKQLVQYINTFSK